jgi:hypothetical protein
LQTINPSASGSNGRPRWGRAPWFSLLHGRIYTFSFKRQETVGKSFTEKPYLPGSTPSTNSRPTGQEGNDCGWNAPRAGRRIERNAIRTRSKVTTRSNRTGSGANRWHQGRWPSRLCFCFSVCAADEPRALEEPRSGTLQVSTVAVSSLLATERPSAPQPSQVEAPYFASSPQPTQTGWVKQPTYRRHRSQQIGGDPETLHPDVPTRTNAAQRRVGYDSPRQRTAWVKSAYRTGICPPAGDCCRQPVQSTIIWTASTSGCADGFKTSTRVVAYHAQSVWITAGNNSICPAQVARTRTVEQSKYWTASSRFDPRRAPGYLSLKGANVLLDQDSGTGSDRG